MEKQAYIVRDCERNTLRREQKPKNKPNWYHLRLLMCLIFHRPIH